MSVFLRSHSAPAIGARPRVTRCVALNLHERVRLTSSGRSLPGLGRHGVPCWGTWSSQQVGQSHYSGWQRFLLEQQTRHMFCRARLAH